MTQFSGKPGFFVSKAQAIIIIALFVVIVVAVGLMAGLIRPPCPQETTPEVDGSSSTSPTDSTTPTAEPTGPEPWFQPFLPSYTRPLHYDLWFYPDFYFDGTTFQGREDVEIEVSQETEHILIHYKMMNITLSQLKYRDGNDIEVERAFAYDRNQYWVVTAKNKIPANSVVVLHLEFTGSLVNGIVGYYKSNYTNVDTGEKSWLATTKFQPADARKAYPNFDEPKYKATFNITLKHWNNFTAISNMPPFRSEAVDSIFNETKFMKTPRMSSYLTAFIVCDFKYLENQLDNGKPHRVYAAPDRIKEAEYALETGKTQQDFFEREFNMSFHLPKLDQAAIPDYPSGATEHWGLITYREARLLYNGTTSSSSSMQGTNSIIAHELAHNFFGDIVTCDWWEDIWLNEGFASFYQNKATNHSEPTWDRLEAFPGSTVSSIMRTDALTSSRPLVINVSHPDQSNQVFDGITYSKGSSLLAMLEDFIGPDLFRKAARHYLKKHEYGTVTTPQLFEDFQEAVGPAWDIKAIMSTWVYQMGFPVVTIQRLSDSGSTKRYQATQTRFLSNQDDDKTKPPSPYGYKWYVPLSWVDANGVTGRTWMNMTDTVTFDVTTNSWVKFNNRQASYYRVNYQESLWVELAQQLTDNHEVLRPSDRAHLLDDVFALAGAKHLEFPTALNMTRYLEKEQHYVPWRAARMALREIGDMFSGTFHYALWRKYMQKLTSGVMDKLGVEDSGSHTEKILRSYVIGLSCPYGYQPCLNNMTSYFTNWIEDEKNVIPPNLRMTALAYGMRQTGGEHEWDTVWERYQKEPSATERGYLAQALAQTPQVWLLQRYLEYLWDSDKIREQDFFTVFTYIGSTPTGERLAWDWARANYQKLRDKFTTANRYFGRMIPSLVSNFKTKFDLEQVEAHFAKFPDAGTGEQPRKEALESIRVNIAWLEKNQEPIVAWLQQQDLS